MQWSFLLLAFLGGIALAVQISTNTSLRIALGHPSPAALVNFLIGFVGLTIFASLMRLPLPSRDAAACAPWWAWVGGLIDQYGLLGMAQQGITVSKIAGSLPLVVGVLLVIR